MVCSGVKYKWLCPLEHSKFYNHSATKVTTNTVPVVRVSGRVTEKQREIRIGFSAAQRYS